MNLLLEGTFDQTFAESIKLSNLNTLHESLKLSIHDIQNLRDSLKEELHRTLQDRNTANSEILEFAEKESEARRELGDIIMKLDAHVIKKSWYEDSELRDYNTDLYKLSSRKQVLNDIIHLNNKGAYGMTEELYELQKIISQCNNSLKYKKIQLRDYEKRIKLIKEAKSEIHRHSQELMVHKLNVIKISQFKSGIHLKVENISYITKTGDVLRQIMTLFRSYHTGDKRWMILNEEDLYPVHLDIAKSRELDSLMIQHNIFTL